METRKLAGLPPRGLALRYKWRVRGNKLCCAAYRTVSASGGVFKESEDCMYCSESGRASSISSGKSVRKIPGSKAQLHCRGFSFSENTEVFRKEPLETKGGISMDEKRGKQKRRDRVSKTKTHSSKSKVSLHYTWPFV